MKSTVSERGQVTIPKALRHKLGISQGQVLDFEAEEGRLVATKLNVRDAVDSVYGRLSDPGPTDAVLEDLRGPAEQV